jgi:hypothetical protein
MSEFYKYFKENMDGLGLPAPESLFTTTQTASGTAATLLGAIEKFGTKITVREAIGAGTKMEGLMIIGACSASYYVGAVIGSLAVASGRSIAGGTSLADVLFVATVNDLKPSWLVAMLGRNPQIYNGKGKKLSATSMPVKR